MNSTKLMGEKLMELRSKKNAARLQATTVALACMGVYSGEEGASVDADTLIVLTDMLMESGGFPMQTLEECIIAFESGLHAFDILKGENR